MQFLEISSKMKPSDAYLRTIYYDESALGRSTEKDEVRLKFNKFRLK